MLPWVVAWARAAALPVFAVAVPWRCSFVAPSLEPRDTERPRVTDPRGPAVRPERSAVQPKEEAPAARVSAVPPRPPVAAPVEAIALPEEVVVRAVAVGQPAFLRCWARAQRSDPMQIAAKVRVHLEVDATGKVTAIESDAESPTLSRCLAVVARQLPFPAPGRPAVVDLPLIFR
jgi:hypothetical protein